MEVKLNSLFGAKNLYIGLLLILLNFCLWRIVKYVWVRPRRLEQWLRAQGFRGNPYRLWYGDLKDLSRITMETQSKPISVGDDIDQYVLPFHHHIVAKYGKRSFIWNGPNPRILITEPDLIREIFNKHDIFKKLFTNPLNRLLITGLVSHEGDKWALHRRIVNPAFNFTKLKDMIPIMHISCMELVEKWQNLMQVSDKLAGSALAEVDVWPYLSNFTADIISRTAFGSNYEQGKMIFPLQKEQARIIVHLSRSMYIPGSRFLPTKANKRMKEIDSELRGIMRDIIQSKEDAMKLAGGESNNSNIDLLGILLESNLKEKLENGNINKNGSSSKQDHQLAGITIDEVIEECKLFYFAGQETTANLLVWTMIMLSIHQDWQIQARQEVLQVFGTRKPDFDGLLQLKKVNMILHEALRLYSPAPAIVRVTEEIVNLGDITLPRGSEIALPLLFVHHDREIWGDDVKEFKPERFANGVTKAGKGGQLAPFFPFGSGPRFCVGQNFAMLEAKLALAVILQHFSFQLSPSYQHAPVQVITMQPKFGAKIQLSKI